MRSTFNYYTPFYSKKAERWCPGVTAKTLTYEEFERLIHSEEVNSLVEAYRNGDKEAKAKLPAVCWTGLLPEGAKRKAEDMVPTQLYIIDIDHIKAPWTPRTAWENIKKSAGALNYDFKFRLVHVTPSGGGLRGVCEATEDFPTLSEHMEWLREKLCLDQYGDFDGAVKDLSRLSFLVGSHDILLWSGDLFNLNPDFKPIIKEQTNNYETPKKSAGTAGSQSNSEYKPLRSQYAGETYHGHLLTDIIDRYLEQYGMPEHGEMHNFYNKMVLDFRHICNNDALILHDLLPRFGGDNPAEYHNTLSQCQSICRRNNNGQLPREFYAFLKKNGYYERPSAGRGIDREVEEEEDNSHPLTLDLRPKVMPKAPPVIAELISICPPDFVIPAINALMPILGTLTSYVRAEDKQQNKTLSTSFFSIIYAPPSSGKSFVEKYINYLLKGLMRRDELNDARDAVYARSQMQKSGNERGEALPQTSIRIMEAKNSEAEFLEKQRNNQGHHMFTYCSEIDQWRKGVRAAGGNKDDMIRIAWDNGRYGQNFKSANTFKGKVNLYWNVLIAGTSDQLQMYFRNVTNGLVTRCCFTEIKNQKFQEKIPDWKTLGKRERKVVDRFIERCDQLTYAEPLSYDVEKCYTIADKDFDNEVPWQVTFRPLQYVSIDWINQTINRFNKEQCRRAIVEQNEARDTFRRRVGERGKRLALLCTQLYDHPMTTVEQKACAKWIAWWMEQDIAGILEPFGKKYEQAMNDATIDATPRRSLFEKLPDEFTREEVRRVADILGYRQDSRNIISDWTKINVVEKMSKDKWRKVKKQKL